MNWKLLLEKVQSDESGDGFDFYCRGGRANRLAEDKVEARDESIKGEFQCRFRISLESVKIGALNSRFFQ